MTTRRKFLYALGLTALSPLLSGCRYWTIGERVPGSTQGLAPKKGQDMDFNAIKLGDHSANPCTPDMPEDFVGIRINTPPTIRWGRDQFAICGTYRFPAEYIYTFCGIHQAIILVAVDAARHIPYACNLASRGSIPNLFGKRPPQKDPDWMANHFIRRYFNIDLMRFMPDFPVIPAKYYIYAMIENNVSNVCRVSCL